MFNRMQVGALRFMSGFMVVVAVMAAVLFIPHLAFAGVSQQISNGELIIDLSGSDEVSVSCVNGLVKLNGIDPQSGPLACASVTSIVVNGGTGDNQIDTSEVTRAAFSTVSTVTINGRAGNDTIMASEVDDTLNGDGGNDTFVGAQPTDRVDGGTGQTWFVEATVPLGGSPTMPGPISRPAGVPAPDAPGLGTSFDSVNFDGDAALTGLYHIPPDPHGTAGPAHVVNVVNTSIQWYTKAGVLQNSQRLGSGGGGFFASLSPVNGLYDPKVIYDQYAGRFVVVAQERRDVATDGVNSSRILVAVSDDSDPNGTWYYHAINSLINIGTVDRWADYPGFAVDNKAVYITSNMFAFSSGGSGFGGVRLWIINKTPFYSGGAASVTVHDPYAGGGSATTTQPAHMFGTSPGSTGTFLVAYSGLSDGTNEYVQVVRVDDPLGTPTFNLQQRSMGDIENAAAAFNDAPQSGTASLVETNDRRALNAVWRDNALWATFETTGAGAEAGQITAHWVKLSTSNLAALTVVDQGNVGGEDIAVGTYTFFPSIAVDPCGNMALSFAASASSIFPGAYYTGRLVTDTAGTVQSSGTLAAGTDYYYRAFGGTRNRWGDYSGIALDPADEAKFWVFNQYAMTRGTVLGPYPTEDGRWSTRFGSFTFNTAGFDFGDLPSTYNVITRTNDGARHCVNATGLRLGAVIDAESDGNPSSAATGDDTTSSDDEDGIVRAGANWANGVNGGSITATVSGGSGVLNAWVDWNGNNSFGDVGDQIITNSAVSAGNNLIAFNIPAGTFTGSGGNPVFNARFRLTAAAPVSATVFYMGTGSSGEVEDYQWTFRPTAVIVHSIESRTTANSVYGLAAIIMGLGAFGSLIYWRRRTRPQA